MDTFAFDINPLSKSMKTNRDIGVMNYRDWYNYYAQQLKELAISRFKWKLPRHLPQEVLERTLVEKGIAAFKFEKQGGLQFYAGASSGSLDIYGYPTKLSLYPAFGQGDSKIYTVGVECVAVYNNMYQYSDMYIIDYYAKQLANLKTTQFTNIKAQKTPNIIATDYKNKLSLINAFQQLETGAQVIYVDKNFQPDSLSVYNTPAPIVFDKLDIQGKSFWNDALTRLGINSPGVEKRERVNTDEVNSNNVEIAENLELRLMMRKRACDEINELFKDYLDEPVEVEASSKIIMLENMKLEREANDNIQRPNGTGG